MAISLVSGATPKANRTKQQRTMQSDCECEINAMQRNTLSYFNGFFYSRFKIKFMRDLKSRTVVSFWEQIDVDNVCVSFSNVISIMNVDLLYGLALGKCVWQRW